MTLEQFREFAAVHQHKFLVQQYFCPIIQDMVRRSTWHDFSKFDEDEFPGLVQAHEDISKVPYGTPEYEEARKKHARTFETHYRKNQHHPEHFKDGILGMNLVDLIELLVDWKAASMRTESGSLVTTMRIGAERYNISPDLIRILENTARDYKLFDSR